MRYVTITKPDINNGEGNRASLWISGCNHHCPGCQNSCYHSYEIGNDFVIDEVMCKLRPTMEKPYIQGLSLLGGDPLAQDAEGLKELREFLVRFRSEFPDKDIWLYSGDVYEDALKDCGKKGVIEMCDVMVDGPFVLAERDRAIAFRGSRNQRIIDVMTGADITEKFDHQ